MIVIIDYKVGNLRSIEKAIEFLGYDVEVTDDIDKIKAASLLVLPGQGSFAEAMKNLNKLGLADYIRDYIKAQKPFLGICVGFQLLFERSYENGVHEGLGIFSGEIKKFTDKNLKIPHMGWNQLNIVNDQNGYFKNIENDSYTYFVHSYYANSKDKNIVSSTTNYGLDFVSTIQAPNLLATQYHPEKSGDIGINLLKNFLKKIL
jgi:imidazole glycerol-phosphate synthase subunit HisH